MSDVSQFIEQAELREKLKAGEKLMLVDVRSAEEFAAGHIDGAINIPKDQLAARRGELPSDVPIVTVCSFGGARSCGASEELHGFGLDAIPLRAGINGWQEHDK
jgi:rhodanese-related sulfurtransferase